MIGSIGMRVAVGPISLTDPSLMLISVNEPCNKGRNMTTESTIVLDELDRALIALLQEDARASYHELPEQCQVSRLQRREGAPERLIDADVIKTVVVPNWPKLGYSFVACRYLSSCSSYVKSGAISMDEVNWVAMTTGAFDLFAQIVLPRNQDITSFITERLAPIDVYAMLKR
ncbi:MAG: Lrp/AsnC family transcriptional regulator [Thermomicrobiales bacterium]